MWTAPSLAAPFTTQAPTPSPGADPWQLPRVVATSAEDPNCTLAIMADGDPTDDYLDWKTTSYGFSANASIYGDSFWYGTFSTYAPFNFMEWITLVWTLPQMA